MKQESTKLDAIQLSILCKELAMFFKEGIPLYDAFLIMEENTENRRLKPLYHQISRSLEEGVALTEALKHTEKFPSYMLRILRIGEESGKLEEVLEALFLYYQRREQMKNSIRSAVFYPLVMIGATLLILAVLMIQVLPVFAQVFEQVGAELPALFAAISESGGIVSAVCIALLIILALALLLYLAGRRTEKGRVFFTRLYETSIFTRSIAAQSESGGFTYSMSLLLSSGMNPDQAAELLLELTESPRTKEKLKDLQRRMAEGMTFARALAESGFLPPAYTSMIAAGTKTGRVDEMMDLTARRLSEDIDLRLERRISLVEPAVVIIMCILIGAVLLSVMLPLIRMMTSF